MSETFYISTEQDWERRKKLEADYDKLREKFKATYRDQVLRVYFERMDQERKNIIMALFILIGGPIAHMFYVGGFWSGVVLTLSIMIGSWLVNEQTKKGGLLQIGNLKYHFDNFNPDWIEWEALERRRLDRLYDRQKWAQENLSGYRQGAIVLVDAQYYDLDYHEVPGPVYPWDRSWLP